jgi:hypothetical protein
MALVAFKAGTQQTAINCAVSPLGLQQANVQVTAGLGAQQQYGIYTDRQVLINDPDVSVQIIDCPLPAVTDS